MTPGMRRSLLLGAGVLLLALACRAPGIRRGLWIDEIASESIARDTPAEIYRTLAGHDIHPPLYYMALSLWQRAGTSETWLRLLSLIAGLLTVWVLALVVREMGSRRAGWLAAWMGAAAYPLCWTSLEVRAFALMNLLAVSAWLFTVRAMKAGGWWRWAAAGACMAGAAYSFYYAFFAIAALCVFVLACNPTRRQWQGFAAACGVAFVLYLPWIRPLLDQLAWAGAERPSGWLPLGHVDQAIKLVLLDEAPWRFASWYGFGVAAYLGWIAFAGRRAFAPQENRWLRATVALALAFAVAVFATEVNREFHSVRYSSFLVTGWIAFAALSLARLKPRRPLTIAILLLLVLGSAARSVRLMRRPHGQDWRAPTAYLHEHSREGDLLIAVQGHAFLPYRYYSEQDFGGKMLPVLRIPHDLPDAPQGRIIYLKPKDFEGAKAIYRRHERIWVLWAHWHDEHKSGERGFQKFLQDDSYTLVSTEWFKGVSVDFFRKKIP